MKTRDVAERKLSLVVPVLNEEQVVRLFVDRLRPTLAAASVDTARYSSGESEMVTRFVMPLHLR